MKRKITVTLALLLIVSAFATFMLGCHKNDPWYNKTYTAYMSGASLDERFERFHMLQLNGDSSLMLHAESGLTAVYFKPTPDASNRKLICTLTGIYVVNITTPSGTGYGHGHLQNIDLVKECIGENLTFTLYVNSDGIITSDDFPTLLPDVVIK